MPSVICEYHAAPTWVFLAGDGSFFHAGVSSFFSMLACIAAQYASLSSSIMTTVVLLITYSLISQLVVGYDDGLEAGRIGACDYLSWSQSY
jgi:hypothetical protein